MNGYTFELEFKIDNVNVKSPIIAIEDIKNEKNNVIYINTDTNKCYKKWDEMILEEYKRHSLAAAKSRMENKIIRKKEIDKKI